MFPLALAASAPALLTIAFLAGATPDEEEFRYAILTSFLHVRALGQGASGAWTSTLGFGVPQPLIPNFDMYPLVPLLAVVSPVAWVRVLYVVHSILGAFGMWHLSRVLRLSPVVRAACVVTFLLATPTQNYALTDFWPSHYVMWTSAPWLLLIAWRMLEATGPDVGRWSGRLGVCAGLVLATTHPGHATVYGVVVLAVVAAEWRAVLARGRWLAAAGLIALAIASPNLVQLATERAVFAADIGLVRLSDPLPLSAAWDVFLRPFSRSEHAWQVDLVQRGTRTLFFGGPFAVLGLLGAFLFGRSQRGLVLGAAIASVLLFTPLLPLLSVHRYHFRDPLILCAVPLAGLAADRLLRLRRTRPLAVLLLGAQLVIVFAAVSPFLDAMWDREGRQAMRFRGATADAGAVDTLLTLMPAPGRLAYSPQIDHEVSQQEWLPDGIGMNALAYRGISVVNGSFKGISTDVLWPDEYLFYGRIRIPQQLAESEVGLDLLGIRYLLANPDERVAADLRRRGGVRTSRGATAVLYENADAGPGAFLLGGTFADVPDLLVYPDCVHDRFLCKDLTPLARLRREDRLEIARRGTRVEIDIDTAPASRMLVLAEMFRVGWSATSEGRALETVSVGPGLLGVLLPPGVTAVRVDYRAPLLVGARVLAWSVLGIGVAALFLRRRR